MYLLHLHLTKAFQRPTLGRGRCGRKHWSRHPDRPMEGHQARARWFQDSGHRRHQPHLGVVRAGRTEAGAEAALLWAVLSSPWCPSLTRSPVACPRTAGGGDDGA